MLLYITHIINLFLKNKKIKKKLYLYFFEKKNVLKKYFFILLNFRCNPINGYLDIEKFF